MTGVGRHARQPFDARRARAAAAHHAGAARGAVATIVRLDANGSSRIAGGGARSARLAGNVARRATHARNASAARITHAAFSARRPGREVRRLVVARRASS